jgi:riboflavin kinase/FMN adenylyltransferase
MRIEGIVVHGKHLGRTIGFPTANIQPDDPASVTAQNGVYVAVISIDGYPARLPCMLNQGTHPTVPEGAPTIEAHILDFADDVYDRRAEVEYLSFLRPEQKFPSLDALKAQLAADMKATRAWFEEK